MRHLIVSLATIAVTALAVYPAKADFVANSTAYFQASGVSTEGIGDFEGKIEVQNISSTSAVIQVTITNISPAANGGFITGFAFNNPASTTNGNITNVTSFSQSYNPEGAPPANVMSLSGGSSDPSKNFNNNISGSPYGSFDIGAAVGGDLLGGGAPQPGIEVGQTGVFTFNVTGSYLNLLTAMGIITASSTDGTAGMIVRFRGFDDGGSDKVISGQVSGAEVVPAPPAVVLAGIGLAGCLFGRSLRRKPVTAQN